MGESRPELLIEETLADLFRSTAMRYPDRLALVCEGRKLTYAELDAWSDSLAADLVSRGFGNGSLVGVWWPRGIELHVAVLSIVKAGATYVPLDREMPEERVITVLTECGAKACFSDSTLSAPIQIVRVLPQPEKNSKAAGVLAKGKGSDKAYILYTSGSTGKPKGIPISQAQICHLVRAEQTVLQIVPEDKVYQGFSVSFDMWCEETWISYFAGACLFVADATRAKAMDELSDFWRAQGITVLHAVPSLLGVLEDDIPSLRIVNAGGEACTKAVLDRWSKPGRRFYNSYGPTETTVTATLVALKPGDAISIGFPLPNYNLAIVDDKLNLVPRGESGELIITGPGVGHGYINLPELSSQKFVAKPATLHELPGDTLYKSGDAAIIHEDGTIEFQGRFDDQIKLRGYRIELGEIENKLSVMNGVMAAAVIVVKDNNGQDELVGYVVVNPSSGVTETDLRHELAKVLPPYMVPGIISFLTEMPRLPSGKINRKKLPVPEAFLAAATEAAAADDPINPFGPMSDRVLATLRKVFPNKTIDLEMDFFTELGGHSLLAATFVSRLRKEAGVDRASLRDVYQQRPLKTLVSHWEEVSKGEKNKERESFRTIPGYRFLTCWLAQSASLLLIFGLFASQVFFPYLGYYYIQQKEASHAYGILAAFLLFICIPPIFTILGIVTKWVVIGRIKEGDYPLWGMYYFRLWFVKAVQELVPIQFLNGTPVYPIYLRMMGVKVSKDAMLSAIRIGAEDLVSIGKDVSISSGTLMNNVTVSGGMMKIRRISIGDHCYIGTSAVIAGGAHMEDWGELQDLSYLPEGKTIRSGEIWCGSPAQRIETKTIQDLPHPAEVSDSQRRRSSWLYSFLLAVFPFAVLLPLFPIIYLINEIDASYADYDFGYMVYMPLLTLFYQFLFMVMTVIFSRLLMRGIKPGRYPVHSSTYVRKWLSDQLMTLSLIVLHPVYATVYISSFFRALGARVGKHTEISTAANVTHTMLNIGKGAFIADAVQLGEADVRAGVLILEETSVGDNSFVGNSALIPQGYKVPGNILIGVLSTPPKAEKLVTDKPCDWFGSPAIALPKRQESQAFKPELTLRPSRLRYAARAFVEIIRIVIPESVIICLSILLIAYGHDLLSEEPWWKFSLLFPIYYLAFIGIPAFLITVVLKWVFNGRNVPRQMPIWTWGVWKSEAITVIYEALSVPFLLQYLKGTPWLPIMMRLLGVKTGRRVWMNTTDITEYDMVSIGDDAALNEDCGPQTHLFEDRVMKVSTVVIGARTSIGAKSIVLYDTEIGDDVHIEPLSLVMKGERLPPATAWTGSPVRPA